jgi:hypothetical protein
MEDDIVQRSVDIEVTVPLWLADDYVDSYVKWREECDAVRHAYRLWQLTDLEDSVGPFRYTTPRSTTKRRPLEPCRRVPSSSAYGAHDHK